MTTRKDVDVLLPRLVAVGKLLGFNDPESWHLYTAYGNKYWLYERAEGSMTGSSALFMPDGFLGTGAKQAHDTLFAIIRTLEEVAYRVDEHTRPERKLARLSRWEGC